jgi:hypothetical protein
MRANGGTLRILAAPAVSTFIALFIFISSFETTCRETFVESVNEPQRCEKMWSF